MVQVSYPGVYIKEVPSGSRTITGVSTSITAFVGVTKRGPIGDPIAVLSYSDYVRNFSDDTQISEMTDQLRQFFLNGGQQAYVLRVANAASTAHVNLNGYINLIARGIGDDGNSLRAVVDYNTAEPERTFNLTVYRETVSTTGVGEIAVQEQIKSLSMDPSNARFAPTVITRDSQLCKAEFTSTNAVLNAAAVPGVSVSGRLLPGADYGTAAVALIGTSATITSSNWQFRITVGNVSKVVTLTATAMATESGIEAAINGTATTNTVSVAFVTTTGTPARNAVTFTADTAGQDVHIESVSDVSSDIASILGWGTAQGGLELGAYRDLRPVANGLVSPLSSATVTALLNLAVTAVPAPTPAPPASGPVPPDANLVTLSGSESTLSLSLQPPKNWGTLLGETIAGGQISLNNLASYLEHTANAFNSDVKNTLWQAQVQGLRLVFVPTYGTASAGAGVRVTAGPTWMTSLFGTTPSTTRGTIFGEGSPGSDPTVRDYNDAFNTLDSKVDLFNLLVLPRTYSEADDMRASLWANASAFCQNNRAFLIIDPTGDITTIDAALQEVKENRLGIVKDHSAMYWPRVAIKPDNSRRYIDPSGTIAGLMARIDGSRGVWKAPAGTEADLRGIFGVETPMSDRENGRLNPEALNCIRAFSSGIISWGARTMDGFDNSGNDDYKYVPVRRFALFLEESLYRGLQWAVFEPNDHRLWSQIRMTVSSFMNGLYRQGAFFGETSKEAYFVKVDGETTTANDINLGICNVIVGFAPVKPAEFIVVTIKQKAGQVQV